MFEKLFGVEVESDGKNNLRVKVLKQGKITCQGVLDTASNKVSLEIEGDENCKRMLQKALEMPFN